MIKPLPDEFYEHATEDELVGMITAPQIITVVLTDSDHPVIHASAKLVGWTMGNQQVYLKPDGYLAFAKDPWVPVEATPAR